MLPLVKRIAAGSSGREQRDDGSGIEPLTARFGPLTPQVVERLDTRAEADGRSPARP